jgi:tRNA1Val (adenine37-N6)-methyltransferase
MKVGTDSVVLGVLVPLLGSEQNILDIGTGSGLLTLMLAQRSFAAIDAIEIDEQASKQSKENFSISPWANRLHCTQISLQDFAKSYSKKYDLIVSNPPYFESNKNYSMEDAQRSVARHDGDLPFADLALGAFKLLNESGSFYLILPVEEAFIFERIASLQGLFLHSQISIIPKEGKQVKRVVQGYSLVLFPAQNLSITLLTSDNKKSEIYHQLTKDFYLDQLDSR